MTKAKPFNPNDLDRELEARHRDAMLDLILTWGSLDGALGMVLSVALGVSHEKGAELIGKLPGSAKLRKLQKILKNAPNGGEASKLLKSHKKQYEKHSTIRRCIAHSHCAGVWTEDRDYIIFASYEHVKGEGLAIDRVPLQEIKHATEWGRKLTDVALKMVDAAEG